LPPEYAAAFELPKDSSLAGFKVAVVGAGPAGLSCADFLSRRGCAVTIFEAQKYAGGLLTDGIPEFVLPQGTVDHEVERLQDQGVQFVYEKALGRDMAVEDLREQFDAVFLGFGAIKARRTGCPGEDAEGIWVAQQYLQWAKVAMMYKGIDGFEVPTIGRHVLVVGAGDTAMDAARTSIRLGAEDVTIVYRRTRSESPSRDCEIEHTMTEGTKFEYLVNPVEYLKDEHGHVRATKLVRMALGEPDASGRRSPEPVPGSEFEQACDTVIMAVGYSAAGEVAGHPEMLNRNGTLKTRNRGGETDMDGVFAGGDVVRGAMTVVHAIRDGRDSADAIGEYLLRKAAEAKDSTMVAD
jgi:glutamate synthase (NADPH/NADH) small chain